MTRVSALCLAVAAGLAGAQPVVLTINPAQSGIDVTATLETPVGNDSDTGASSVSGTIEIELDDYGNPASVTLVDFIIVLDNNITLNFGFGFFGSAQATLTNAMAMYGNPGTPLGPVGLAGAAFSFADVPAILGGNADYSYSIFLVGSGADTIVLSDLGVFSAPIDGNVTSDGDTVTLTGDLLINVSEPLLDGLATLNLSGTASLVATGDAPAPAGCNAADVAAPFGVLDLADIGAFVSAFTTQQPLADLAPPTGVYDLADLGAFVASFTAGCP